MWNRALLAALALLSASSCREAATEPRFPKAHREVAPIVSGAFSTEDARDRVGEAEQVMTLAEVKPGMWVADVGAGEGYYTVRLAPVVGRKGRVLAEDIVPDTIEALSERVQRGKLDNVAVKLGTPDDPTLPAHSFDRIFLVHMYHEVQSPYAFLWHLREALKPGGEVVVVDSNRPIERHGIPPKQLQCELRALALNPARMHVLSGGEDYLMSFRAAGPRPEPEAIRPCRS